MSSFSENLLELMKENNISQTQLAKVLGVKQQTVSRYIIGEREPDIDMIIKIAKYFDVSVDILFGINKNN